MATTTTQADDCPYASWAVILCDQADAEVAV